MVTTTTEHNSLAKAVASLRTRGVEVVRMEPDKEGFIRTDEVERVLEGGADLFALSHASNVYGAIQDVGALGRLCRSRGVLFMVDAAQTTGAVPVDVVAMNIDILATTGHKALFGPQGTGFLYVREGVELSPLIEGGTGDEASMLEMPERLEAGTLNTPGIGGLRAGVDFVLSEGVERIREHETALMQRLMDGLSSMEGASIIGPARASERVSLLAFNLQGLYPVPLGVALDREHSIMVRCGTHCAPEAHRTAGTFPEGALRVSPGYFSTEEDIDAFLSALEEVRGRC